jgi:glycosyltransferase involved in cell wall biosynthesis
MRDNVRAQQMNSNSQVRILVVSYTFPPDAAVGGLRIARLCAHLLDHGIQPIVLSVYDRFHEGLDHSVVLPAGVRVVRTKCMRTPRDWYRRAKQLLTRERPEAGTETQSIADPSFVRRQIRAFLEFPDRYWGWYFHAKEAAAQLIEKEGIHVIFSSGPPWISHLIARKLKKEYQLPWIADFRDPWAHLLPEKNAPWWSQYVAEKLEDSCIEIADLVVCNTDRLRRAYQNCYGDVDGVKFRTLTNGYEDSRISYQARPSSGKRIFLHLGSIYGLRRIDTFLQAIADLTRSGRLDSNSFQLIFQGQISNDFIAAAEEICPDLLRCGCLEFRPRVSWEEAQRILTGADRLLLFQGNYELQVPAKFYEYLPTGIPIFAVTEEGALTDLLNATGSGLWAKPADPRQIAERFIEVLAMPRRTPEYLELNLNGKFQYRNLASQFGGWVRALASQGRESKAYATVSSGLGDSQ